MESKSKKGSESGDTKKPQRVTVSEPNESGISAGQIAVLAILALLIIVAIVVILFSYDPYIRP